MCLKVVVYQCKDTAAQSFLDIKEAVNQKKLRNTGAMFVKWGVATHFQPVGRGQLSVGLQSYFTKFYIT